jgi:hypothetical protein
VAVRARVFRMFLFMWFTSPHTLTTSYKDPVKTGVSQGSHKTFAGS